MSDTFQTRDDVVDWCRQVGYSVNEYVLESHGTERCDLCGEPLASGLDGIGEFSPADPDGDSVVAHAQCGIDHGLEVA